MLNLISNYEGTQSLFVVFAIAPFSFFPIAYLIYRTHK